MEPQELRKKALSGVVKFQIILAILIMLPAWSLHFWQAWLYWCVFLCCTLFMTLYFLKHDPHLVASRLSAGPTAEREKRQKVLQCIMSVFLGAMYITPGIERHVHASPVPPVVAACANLFVVIGFVIMFYVFKENGHASSIIEVKEGQRVVTTGPYAYVRHPMYSGALVMFLATPVALGSWWALLCALGIGALIVARLLDEERFLSKNLPGYDEYRAKTRYRLIPYLW